MNRISPSKEEKEDVHSLSNVGGQFTALATWGWGWCSVFVLEQYVIVCKVV